MVDDGSQKFEPFAPKIEEKSKVVSGQIANKSNEEIYFSSRIYFMDTDANYDKYLNACIKRAGSSQKVRQVSCVNNRGEQVMWHNPMHNTLQDILKDNPKLAAFTEVKAFGDLAAANKPLLTITKYDDTVIVFNTPGDGSQSHLVVLSHAIKNPINTFKDFILENNKQLNMPSDSAEAVGLFLSRYLHENNGLLDNLPSSYGLTIKSWRKKVRAVHVSVISYNKPTKTVSITIDLTLEPTRLLNSMIKHNPDVTAEMSIPLVLHTKGYETGDEKQKLIIEVPKAGPLVEFYHTKTKKPLSAKTNAELLGLMALGMTDLRINVNPKNPKAELNSDKWISKELIKEAGEFR